VRYLMHCRSGNFISISFPFGEVIAGHFEIFRGLAPVEEWRENSRKSLKGRW